MRSAIGFRCIELFEHVFTQSTEQNKKQTHIESSQPPRVLYSTTVRRPKDIACQRACGCFRRAGGGFCFFRRYSRFRRHVSITRTKKKKKNPLSARKYSPRKGPVTGVQIVSKFARCEIKIFLFSAFGVWKFRFQTVFRPFSS